VDSRRIVPIHPAFAEEAARNATAQVTAQATAQVAPQVAAVLKAALTPCRREQLQMASGLIHREHFRKQYLLPLLAAGLIEMTVPDTPRSSNQQYQLTPAGRTALDTHNDKS
jgi:ATP-dependent DNA helicase RecG